MIFRDRYYLNNVFNKLEDNHNMIRIVNREIIIIIKRKDNDNSLKLFDCLNIHKKY